MNTNNSYQGRWGFHPVSHETFLKLKELKKFYFVTLRQLGTWVRWDRKMVHKVGPEPKYCPMFVEDKKEWRKHVNKDGFTEYRYYPKTRNDRGVLEAFEVARMPKATAEEVVPLKLSDEEIDKLYSQMKAWLEGKPLVEKKVEKALRPVIVSEIKSTEQPGLLDKVAAFLRLKT